MKFMRQEGYRLRYKLGIICGALGRDLNWHFDDNRSSSLRQVNASSKEQALLRVKRDNGIQYVVIQ